MKETMTELATIEPTSIEPVLPRIAAVLERIAAALEGDGLRNELSTITDCLSDINSRIGGDQPDGNSIGDSLAQIALAAMKQLTL
jgi:hypothetical protein